MNIKTKYKARKKWEVRCKILMICHFHIVFSWSKSFFDSNYPNLSAIFVWQFFFFQRIKSQVKLSKINCKWLQPTENVMNQNVMNQTSSFFFHLSLGHKNNEWGLELSLGQTIGCWWDNFLKVAMTSSTRQSTRGLCQFCWKFCNIDFSKFRNSLTKFKNQTSRHLHQRKLFKVHILEFKAPSYEEIPHAKIPKA